MPDKNKKKPTVTREAAVRLLQSAGHSVVEKASRIGGRYSVPVEDMDALVAALATLANTPEAT